MRETVFFRLPAVDDAEVLCRVTSETAVTSYPRRVATQQLGTYTQGRKVIVFVPSVDVRLAKVVVPARQPSKALQAVPFLLEDQFADDVDTLHFALGARRNDGSFPVAAVALPRFTGWIEQLRALGVEPDALVPEALALPWTAGNWTALVDDAVGNAAGMPEDAATNGTSVAPNNPSLLIRTDDCASLNSSVEELDLMIKLAAGEQGPPRIRVLIPQSCTLDFSKLELPLDLAPGYADALDILIRHYTHDAINLLQGAFAKSTSYQQYLLPWKKVAVLAAGVFLATVALNATTAYRLNQSADQLETANDSRFRTLFPTERPTAYLAAQLDALMRRDQGTDTGVMFLLQKFASALTETPGLTLRAFQYHDHALFADMTGKDVDSLEKLRTWFTSNPGVKLEVQQADAGSEGVQIRIKLSAS